MYALLWTEILVIILKKIFMFTKYAYKVRLLNDGSSLMIVECCLVLGILPVIATGLLISKLLSLLTLESNILIATGDGFL